MADIFLFNFYESKQLSLDKVDVTSRGPLMNEWACFHWCKCDKPAHRHRICNTKSITKYNLTIELRAVTVAAALLWTAHFALHCVAEVEHHHQLHAVGAMMAVTIILPLDRWSRTLGESSVSVGQASHDLHCWSKLFELDVSGRSKDAGMSRLTQPWTVYNDVIH